MLDSVIKLYPTSNISRADCEAVLLEMYPRPFQCTMAAYKALISAEYLKLHRLYGSVRRAWRRTPTGGRASIGRLKAQLTALQPSCPWPTLPAKTHPDISFDDSESEDHDSIPSKVVHVISDTDEDSPASVPQDKNGRVDPAAAAAELTDKPPPRYRDLKKCLRKPAGALSQFDAVLCAKQNEKSQTGKQVKKSQTGRQAKQTGKAMPQSKPGSFYWLNRWHSILDILPECLKADKAVVPHGDFSYTVKSQRTKNLSIQVLLRKRAYYIAGATMPDGRTTVVWSTNGGSPTAAWKKICKHIRL